MYLQAAGTRLDKPKHSHVLQLTTEAGQTFAKHSSSISGGVGGGLDGGKGLLIHHFPAEERKEC